MFAGVERRLLGRLSGMAPLYEQLAFSNRLLCDFPALGCGFCVFAFLAPDARDVKPCCLSWVSKHFFGLLFSRNPVVKNPLVWNASNQEGEILRLGNGIAQKCASARQKRRITSSGVALNERSEDMFRKLSSPESKDKGPRSSAAPEPDFNPERSQPPSLSFSGPTALVVLIVRKKLWVVVSILASVHIPCSVAAVYSAGFSAILRHHSQVR